MAYNGFSVAEVLESKSIIKRHVDKLRRRVWLYRVCYGLLVVGLAALVAIVGFQPNQSPSDRPLLSLPWTYVPTSTSKNDTAVMYIEDVINMDTEVLVLVRRPRGSAFPCKRTLECRYGEATRKPTAVHLYHHRAAVVCPAPPRSFQWDVNSMSITVGPVYQILPKVTAQRSPLQWFRNGHDLTYEAFSTETDVVVFVHGLNNTRGIHLSAVKEEARLRQLKCVYGGYYETKVTAQAQEVFRCAPPPVDLVHQFAGRKISVKVQERILPSVAYYHPELNHPDPQSENSPELSPEDKTTEPHAALDGSVHRKLQDSSNGPEHDVCSCTMIYNGAKFLKEWVYYNSHLGVKKFFLYDNNSDDDLDEVISALGSRGFLIQKQAWPWVKTQEAGFSHCSVFAQNDCKWMLFTDVDEFLFPSKHFLSNSTAPAREPRDERAVVPARANSSPATTKAPLTGTNSTTILARFIAKFTEGREFVGQICAYCYNFGPSGFHVSPPQGVTQGYTCRMRKTERHKSLVLLRAVHASLENVIHHFTLKSGYEREVLGLDVAVINHYKFQAWEEFKVKFHRRAATYVADWTEKRNQGSKDRVPDLGTRAIKPADWETRYCEVRDYELKNYTQNVFGSYDRDHSLHLPWE